MHFLDCLPSASSPPLLLPLSPPSPNPPPNTASNTASQVQQEPLDIDAIQRELPHQVDQVHLEVLELHRQVAELEKRLGTRASSRRQLGSLDAGALRRQVGALRRPWVCSCHWPAAHCRSHPVEALPEWLACRAPRPRGWPGPASPVYPPWTCSHWGLVSDRQPVEVCCPLTPQVFKTCRSDGACERPPCGRVAVPCPLNRRTWLVLRGVHEALKGTQHRGFLPEDPQGRPCTSVGSRNLSPLSLRLTVGPPYVAVVGLPKPGCALALGTVPICHGLGLGQGSQLGLCSGHPPGSDGQHLPSYHRCDGDAVKDVHPLTGLLRPLAGTCSDLFLSERF